MRSLLGRVAVDVSGKLSHKHKTSVILNTLNWSESKLSTAVEVKYHTVFCPNYFVAFPSPELPPKFFHIPHNSVSSKNQPHWLGRVFNLATALIMNERINNITDAIEAHEYTAAELNVGRIVTPSNSIQRRPYYWQHRIFRPAFIRCNESFDCRPAGTVLWWHQVAYVLDSHYYTPNLIDVGRVVRRTSATGVLPSRLVAIDMIVVSI